MHILGLGVVALLGLLHVYIAWFEIFAWETRGPVAFPSFPEELFPQTVDMAANQGLYNGFLAAGLFWSLLIRDRRWQYKVAICFLMFVLVAGVFGALTVSPSILMVQAVPATVGLVFVGLSLRRLAD